MASRDDDLIPVVDPEIDVDRIVAEVRAKAMGSQPAPGGGELAWQIFSAAEAARDLLVGDQLRETRGLVGALANGLRRPFHTLVRFYVDALARKQAAVDGHAIAALRLLAERIEQLEAEVAELRRERP